MNHYVFSVKNLVNELTGIQIKYIRYLTTYPHFLLRFDLALLRTQIDRVISVPMLRWCTFLCLLVLGETYKEFEDQEETYISKDSSFYKESDDGLVLVHVVSDFMVLFNN